MLENISNLPPVTMGIDIGDRTSRVYIVDAAGARVEECTIASTPSGVTQLLEGRAPCRVAMEVGTHSPWMSRVVASLGHEVIVGNPSAMYGRRRRRRRNDALDAEFLARQARADVSLLHPIQHRRASVQTHLEVLHARDQLVALRTKLINHVRGVVKATGARLPAASAEAFPARVTAAIPPVLTPAVLPLLETITTTTQTIRAYDRQIAALQRTTYPVAQRLQQVPGVGPLTSLAFVLLVDAPTRFRRSRDVGAYFGLVPQLDESSDSTPQLRITKAGDAYGRRLLVSAAQYILGPFGPPCDLRRHGEGIYQRGGKNARKRAVVAVARKLAVLLHRLWVSEQPYEPQHTAHRRAA